MNLTKREILEYLKLIDDELTSANINVPDIGGKYNLCSYSVNTAHELVGELTNRLEDNQEEPVPHEDMDREGGLMGPDGLPLIHIDRNTKVGV